MKQPKYLALFLAGTLVFGGFAPAYVSASTTVDVTAPTAPVVSAPLHTSTSLTIEGEVGAKAEIVINGKTYVRTVLEGGLATFNMAPQSVGKVIEVRLVDASGNASDVTRVVVAEDPAARPATPVVKPVTNSSRALEVKGEPGLSFVLTIGNTTVSSKFDANGIYRRHITLQPVGTPITVQAKSTKGALSDLVKTKVVTDRYAPKPGRITQAVTTTSTGVAGKAEPYATALVTVGTKTYSAPVMSTGNFVVKIPKQPIGQKMSLVIRDGAGNKSTPATATVQHALYNNFHRVTSEGMRLTLHKEVFRADTSTRYDETFAPVFLGHPSKANLHFLLSYYAEDGEPIEFEKLRIRVGSATYTQNISFDDVGYTEYADGTLEETYFFKPNAKLVSFVKQHVRLENRIVVTVEGYEYDLEFPLVGAEKRAFIQSLQYAGY
ncbi:Ig-like domain-containing protein [Exiguobacterium alkaliphilum]|uniref:Ig-like domain-containing protein n=1 Tax=Exiguobacterium alkaliphilum TaxID=1428684 RepID=A0ABT2KWV1_9BACL|nr:Ig-like domain-containing protein [Exiguobacterium alkaliphilum]MCT4794801.1 Ig-like domain-containing protein [Exiguobacterium alkaliphilum]